jgi:glycosyltransferase involved in cell wall biosynthesis
MNNALKVLALAPYPEQAASTRFRIAQFIPLLRQHGIVCELKPFISNEQFARLYHKDRLGRNALGLVLAAAARTVELLSARQWDVVFIQREAALVGPPWFERMIANVFRKPIVLDLDDPLWIHYTSPVYGRLGSRLRCLNKTGELIRRAAHVVCGNDLIAAHVSRMGMPASVLPTIVDTRKFAPQASRQPVRPPVIGWIGTHTTLPYLEAIMPALEKLAHQHAFKLKVIGGGRAVQVRGVDVDTSDWSLGREVEDFRSLDIGLYPLTDDEWSRGKSGFKAVQYLCCGVPFVASPVGVVKEIAEQSKAALLASSTDEWVAALDRLLTDQALRAEMRRAGREFALRRYRFEDQAARLSEILFAAAGCADGATAARKALVS